MDEVIEDLWVLVEYIEYCCEMQRDVPKKVLRAYERVGKVLAENAVQTHERERSHKEEI